MFVIYKLWLGDASVTKLTLVLVRLIYFEHNSHENHILFGLDQLIEYVKLIVKHN